MARESHGMRFSAITALCTNNSQLFDLE